jgi:DNA polymerase I-like protein with 3'-5' exonuclease and polymerase domains
MVSVLVSMEQRGICLSKRVLGQQKPAMLRKLLQLEAQAAAANGGEKFNLAAPGEVGKVRLGPALHCTPCLGLRGVALF